MTNKTTITETDSALLEQHLQNCQVYSEKLTQPADTRSPEQIRIDALKAELAIEEEKVREQAREVKRPEQEAERQVKLAAQQVKNAALVEKVRVWAVDLVAALNAEGVHCIVREGQVGEWAGLLLECEEFIAGNRKVDGKTISQLPKKRFVVQKKVYRDLRGKIFFARRSYNPHKRGTRGHASYQIVIDNPGIDLKEYKAKGGHRGWLVLDIDKDRIRVQEVDD